MKPLIALAVLLTSLACSLSCGSDPSAAMIGTPPPVGSTEDLNPLGPVPPAAMYPTSLDRAFGIAAGILARMKATEAGGTWVCEDASGKLSSPATAYEGTAGVLIVLARIQRVHPHPEVEKALRTAGQWLKAQGQGLGPGLHVGKAGLGWALLELYETLGDRAWLEAGLAHAAEVAADSTQVLGSPGDLIWGHAGQGFFLLKAWRVSGDARWLRAAQQKADESIAQATVQGEGFKFMTVIGPQERVCYVGFAHGAAGTGYFFCRLAEALGSDGRPYRQAAEKVGAWLQAIAIENSSGLNWYRREPDQMNEQQNQWCHGAPGIGLFFAELHRQTLNPEHLRIARRAAETTLRLPQSMSCLCHGTTGNAYLYLKLYGITGESVYLDQAKAVGDRLWATWDRGLHHPSWMGNDGSQVRHNAGLMTGNAGRAHFYLSLSDPARWPMPFTE